MEYTFGDFLRLIGSLAIFIYGMKVMNEGLQKVAGEKLRKLLAQMTSSRWMGVLTGFIITALLQTSSGTIMMVVSFVNAGLLRLAEAMYVIMGANIGTTLTTWIITYFGFKMKILTLALPSMGIALPFYFSRNRTYSSIAEFVIGFGIFFIGLEFIKESVPYLKSNPAILAFLQTYSSHGPWSILLSILIGAILTIAVQFSGAASAITMALFAQGYIDFPIAAAVFLGENIGTAITANIAATVGNVHAKRAARFHLLFNILGTCWMLLVFRQFLSGIDLFLYNITGLSPLSENVTERAMIILIAIALFHTLFNVSNTLLFIGFVPWLEKLLIKLQPSKGTDDEQFHLKYISRGVLSTAELSIEQAKKEIQLLARLLDKMCLNILALLFEKIDNPNRLVDKIRKREEITDKIEIEIAEYLSKCAEGEISGETSEKIRSMLSMINDMERIGDIFSQMTMNIERMRRLKTKFSEEIKEELRQLFDLLYAGIKQMRENLEKEKSFFSIKDVYDHEQKINALRDRLQQSHYKRLEERRYSVQDGIIFLDFINSAEKIGDHIVNINEAIVGLK